MSDEFEVIQHPQISNINIFLVNVDYRTPHLHRDLEIDMIIDGEAIIVCQNKTYTLQAGDMILLNPNQLHEIKTTNNSAAILCLQVSPRLFKDIYPTFESISFNSILPFDHASASQKIEIQRKFIELATQYMRKTDFYEILCLGLLDLLLFDFLNTLPYRTILQDEFRANILRVERLNRIIQFVDANFTHKIRLTDLAETEGLSLSYLSHFVKDNLNQTFQDYVSNVRFTHARKLLLSGSMRMLDICIESGFSDPRFMTKAFIANTGMTPDEYRKKIKIYNAETKQQNQNSSQQYYSPEDTIEKLAIHRALRSVLE